MDIGATQRHVPLAGTPPPSPSSNNLTLMSVQVDGEGAPLGQFRRAGGRRPLFEPEFARKGGLCGCADAPENSRRTYILSGYRPLDSNSDTVTSIFKSMTFFHNESGNIWTHFLSLLFFIGVALYHFFGAGFHLTHFDKLVSGIYFACVLYCFAASVCFHALACKPNDIYQRALSCDLVGIVGCILGSYYIGLWIGFRCFLDYAYVYMTVITLMVLPLFGIIAVRKLRQARLIVAPAFSLVVAAGLIPTYHITLIMDYHVLSNVVMMCTIVLMFGFYGAGVTVYAFHIPERFFPGIFDYVFGSHQWWHLCVFLALLSQYIGVYFTFKRASEGLDSCEDQELDMDLYALLGFISRDKYA